MKKVNDFILLLELVLLSVPLTILLLAIGVPIAFKQLIELFSSDTVIIALIVLLSAYAMVCIWRLVISYIRNDPILGKKYYLYWSGVIVGILISIGAFLSGYLAQPEPYTQEWWFYDQLITFAFGVPLIVPVVHLYLSAWFSKNANKALNSQPSAAGTPQSGAPLAKSLELMGGNRCD